MGSHVCAWKKFAERGSQQQKLHNCTHPQLVRHQQAAASISAGKHSLFLFGQAQTFVLIQCVRSIGASTDSIGADALVGCYLFPVVSSRYKS